MNEPIDDDIFLALLSFGSISYNEPQFYNRMRGVPEPTISEAEALTKIFNGLGITKIWDGDGETL